MKIGIIADTHDDISNLKMALATLQAEGVTTILHCGDVCGPHMIRALAGFDVWIVQGNIHNRALSNVLADIRTAVAEKVELPPDARYSNRPPHQTR